SLTARANAVRRRAAPAPSGAWCRAGDRRFFARCASASRSFRRPSCKFLTTFQLQPLTTYRIYARESFLGAPPIPRLGMSEAKLQDPGRQWAAGTSWAVCKVNKATTNAPHALAGPGPGAARNEVERRPADPGPPRTRTVPVLQRTTSCCAAPGTRERRDPAFVRDRWVSEQPTCGCRK